MSMLDVALIPAFSDNYIFLLTDPADPALVAIVDPGDADPVVAALERLGRPASHILITHHHPDHVGGMPALKQRYGCQVIGPASETSRISDMDVLVGEGDLVSIGDHQAKVFEVPGHTTGHIAYWFGADQALFCGDTLFALGCGRVFEGTMPQMWQSLVKLRDLPADTRVYCAHEYTQANARFAVTIDPDNAELADRARAIDAARAADHPTVPSRLGQEIRTNPFLRADDPAVQAHLGMTGAAADAVFAEIRSRKDNF